MDWLALGVGLGSGCWMDVPRLQRLSWCVSFQPHSAQPPSGVTKRFSALPVWLMACLPSVLLKLHFFDYKWTFRLMCLLAICTVFCCVLQQVRLCSPWGSQEVGAEWYSSVQSLSCVQLFSTPWTTACQASLSITNSRSSPKLMSIESVMPSNHLILCHPLLLPPSIFPSIRVFSNESVLHIRWSKYWSFSFSISPSNEYSGLISFRIDWLDLLAVQGALKSLLQHHSSKAAILWRSAFFIVQL